MPFNLPEPVFIARGTAQHLSALSQLGNDTLLIGWTEFSADECLPHGRTVLVQEVTEPGIIGLPLPLDPRQFVVTVWDMCGIRYRLSEVVGMRVYGAALPNDLDCLRLMRDRYHCLHCACRWSVGLGTLECPNCGKLTDEANRV